MHVQCVPCATTHPSLSHVNQEPVEDVHKFSCAYAPIPCCEMYLCKTTQSGFHLEGASQAVLGADGPTWPILSPGVFFSLSEWWISSPENDL